MLILTFIQAVFTVKDGYHSFRISESKPFSVSLSTKMIIFALDEPPPPSINFSVVDRRNRTSPIPISTITHLQLFETTIHVTAPPKITYVLHYWIFPRSLCSSVSYAAIADRSISFELSSPRLTSNFCIFPQSGSRSYTWSIDYQSAAPSAAIEFYSNTRQISQVCKGHSCSHTSSSPVFVRVVNATDYEFRAAVAFTTFRTGISSYECSIKTTPLLIQLPVQIPSDLVSVTDIKCTSMAETILIWLVIGIVIVGIVTVLVLVLQLYGVINIRSMFGLSVESEHFTTLRENPYASELDPEATQ
jgi:hypothetical protein